MLGRVLTSRLTEEKVQVFIFSRNPEKHEYLAGKGVEFIKGDLTDFTAIDAAVKGKDVVIWSAHSLLGRGKYISEKIDEAAQNHVIQSCKKHSVKRAVMMSVTGADQHHPVDFWRLKWKMENAWKSSGIPYTIIRASAFMEMHAWELQGKMIKEKGKSFILGKGESRMNFVSVDNIASFILICLSDDKHANQTYEIGGLDNVSRVQFAKIVGDQLHIVPKIIKIPRMVLKVMKIILQPFHPGLARVMALSLYTDQTDTSFDVQPLLDNLPLKITRLEEFVKMKIKED
jgi:NADH dehydrogenase